MTDFTFDELVLTDEIANSAGDYGYFEIRKDVSQGAFTQQTIDDLLARAPADEYPNFAAHINTLVADLVAGGQVSATPAAFTADETTQMQFLLAHQSSHQDVIHLVRSAEYVGFWSDTSLAALEALAAPDRHYIGLHSQAAVVGLVDDLVAGGQVLHHG